MWKQWLNRFHRTYTPAARPQVEALLERLRNSPPTEHLRLLNETDTWTEVEALEAFLQVLELPHQALALQAVRKAVERSPTNAWTVLWVALHHADQWIRRTAVMTLARVQDSRAFRLLVSALADESPFVRQIAARGLGALERPECVSPLLTATQDPNGEIRLEALKGLALSFDERVSHRLIALLHDPEYRVVRYAAHLLNQREEPKILPLLAAALPTLPPKAYEVARLVFAYHVTLSQTTTLLPFMRDPQPPIRLCVARELASRNDDTALPGLREGLSDTHPEIQDLCFSALAERNDVPAAETLGQLLASPHRDLRSRAVKALGRMEVDQAEEFLTRALEDTSELVRVEATTTLGQQPITPQRGWVIQASRDASPQVRRQVVRILATLQGEWVTKLLLGLSEDPSPEVQYPALRTLIEQRVLESSLLGPYAGILSLTLVDEEEFSPSIRKECARLLGNSKTPKALPPLIRATQDPDVVVRRAAVEALAAYGAGPAWDALASMIETKDLHIVATIALTLGRPGDRRSAEFLIRAAIELTGAVSKEAKHLLVTHGFFSLEKLIEFLKSKGGRVDDLVREGFVATQTTGTPEEHVNDEFIRRIIQRIKSGNRSIRRFTLEQLQGVQDPRVIEPVTWCLKDDDSDIRQLTIGILARFLTDPGVFESLEEAIFDADSAVGKTTIDALGTVRERRAVKPLLKALRTRSLERRATVAIRRINDKKGIVALRRHLDRKKLKEVIRKQAIERAFAASAYKREGRGDVGR